MRTIKFRGKSIDSNEWLYGDLVRSSDMERCAILVNDRELYDECEVYPLSIGQFTGLYDKNGREIYEGDIVDYEDGVLDDVYKELGTINRGTILFSYGQFYVTNRNCVDMTDLISHDVNFDGEVIGNIHDDPELLKN